MYCSGTVMGFVIDQYGYAVSSRYAKADVSHVADHGVNAFHQRFTFLFGQGEECFRDLKDAVCVRLMWAIEALWVTIEGRK